MNGSVQLVDGDLQPCPRRRMYGGYSSTRDRSSIGWMMKRPYFNRPLRLEPPRRPAGPLRNHFGGRALGLQYLPHLQKQHQHHRGPQRGQQDNRCRMPQPEPMGYPRLKSTLFSLSRATCRRSSIPPNSTLFSPPLRCCTLPHMLLLRLQEGHHNGVSVTTVATGER